MLNNVVAHTLQPDAIGIRINSQRTTVRYTFASLRKVK